MAKTQFSFQRRNDFYLQSQRTLLLLFSPCKLIRTFPMYIFETLITAIGKGIEFLPNTFLFPISLQPDGVNL